jgi:hypothetical protein
MKSVITVAAAMVAFIAAASPARAQGCGEGDSLQFCGFVWNDANGDGIQNDDPDNDPSNGDQSGLNEVKVTLYVWDSMNNQWDQVTETVTFEGRYEFSNPPDGFDDGLYKVVVSAPFGSEPTCLASDPMCPSSGIGDNTIDNDGVNDAGGAKVEVTLGSGGVVSQESDFGFHSTGTVSPGTGTPGYWKNHPEAWPSSTISIGGVTYSVANAISYMGKVSKDKRISLFTALVAAKLNVAIGNENSCIAARITEADAWMSLHQLVPGSVPVAAGSEDWQAIAEAHKDLDDYNNGRLCAPHRN